MYGRLFYGTLKQRITAITEDDGSQSPVNEREDLFSLLPVNVSDEGYDLYDSLGGYFDDVVEFEGQKARMDVTLVDLPPILQIQLQVSISLSNLLDELLTHTWGQRAQFDRETVQPYKSQAYVKFGETLHMDRFLDSANPDKKERSKTIHAELALCRDRIYQITTGIVSSLEFLFHPVA